jgi:peptide/nickel transport system substrate-binding protein
MKRNLLAIGLLLTLVIVFTSFAFAEIVNPDTIIVATIGGPESIDPAWSYDTASGEVIYNLYDNLIDYKGESVSEFVPMLSTEVPSVENGLISKDGLTYIFPIREGVKFHNGDILTPEDVEYSFKRSLIFDRSGGPMWMLLEPLCGVTGIENLAIKLAGVENYSDLFEDDDPKGELKSNYKEAMIKVYTDYVDKAVEVDGNKVILHLVQPYAPLLNIIAHAGSWAAIINKKWTIEQGGWDGQADTWWKYHDPVCEEDPLFKIANGTGPFILTKWIPEEIVMFERFDDYWQGPAKIKNAQIKGVNEWTTRKLMLQAGDADLVYVPQPYMTEIRNMKGVKIVENLPTLANTVAMMPWEINAEGNALIGSGKLDGEGIPADFFNDIHVRKGFSHLFPYEVFIKKVLQGQAIRNPGPLIKGLLGYSDDPSLFYEFSLLKAKREFEQAWDGQLWEKGFKFTLYYNEGNAVRQAFAEMLSTYANMINPKFKITVVGATWSAYLPLFLSRKLPMYTIGWLADYPDPHNWVPTYMSTYGAFAGFFGEPYLKFAKENVDPLCDKAIKSDDPEERAEIYKQLIKIAHDQAISLYLYQPIGHHVERTWVKGWYFNPMRPGVDFYSLSKSE